MQKPPAGMKKAVRKVKLKPSRRSYAGSRSAEITAKADVDPPPCGSIIHNALLWFKNCRLLDGGAHRDERGGP